MTQPDWSKWNSKEDHFHDKDAIASTLVYGTLPKTQPEVAVMIPTFKRPELLKAAVESALAQKTTVSYVICVLDNTGEKDPAADALMRDVCARHANVLYYRHAENVGLFANWNRCISMSPAPWLCMLHDDDALMPDYLETVMAAIRRSPKTLGVMGVYYVDRDMRKGLPPKTAARRAFEAVIRLFVRLRGGRPIPLRNGDNMKLMYPFPCCLMLNRDIQLPLGGFDERYYPSADYTLYAKTAYFGQTAFLPEYLCYHGISENESLRTEVCQAAIRCAFHQTMEMGRAIGKKHLLRKASIAAVIAELGVRGYNPVDYGDVKRELGMKPLYNKPFMRRLIMIYSRLSWALLLLRPAAKEKIA